MAAGQLTELQLELECIGVDSGNLLIRVPCANPDNIARFLVVHHDDAYTVYFRHDLPHHIREALAALPHKHAYEDHGTVTRILGQDAPCTEISSFKSYVFPDTLSPDIYPDAGRLPDKNEFGRPVYGIVVASQVVSACVSSRENAKCAEAWVWTLPPFQRRGYARQATVAWAHDLQRQGKIPFYSHKSSNLASQAVAQSLGLIRFQAAVAYS
jgi:hypothetical protein